MWRRSWKRSLRSPSPVSPLSVTARLKASRAAFLCRRGAPAAGREHVCGRLSDPCLAFVVAQDRSELGDERDLTDGGAGLRRDPLRGDAAAAAVELVADVDDAGGEVDFAPAEREELREPHPGPDRGCQERSVADRRRLEQPGEL